MHINSVLLSLLHHVYISSVAVNEECGRLVSGFDSRTLGIPNTHTPERQYDSPKCPRCSSRHHTTATAPVTYTHHLRAMGDTRLITCRSSHRTCNQRCSLRYNLQSYQMNPRQNIRFGYSPSRHAC
jgi:hypothetical protein